jgi:hypothetical protein
MSITQRTPKNTNTLSRNRFKLIFPRVPHVEYFAQSLTIPEITVPPVEQPTPFAPVRVIGINAHFPPFTVNILCDEDLMAWQEIHDWLVNTSFPRNFDEFQEVKKKGLYSDMLVLMNSNANVPTFEFRFHNIFPSALGAIELTAADDGTETIIFPATFSYTDYEIRRIKHP